MQAQGLGEQHSPSELNAILTEVVAQARSARVRGRITSQIPALDRIDPASFGIALATADGGLYGGGQAGEPFSIQSISKVFSVSLVLSRFGATLWDRVGREASGASFNAIGQVERDAGMPRNPFVNAGALIVTDMMLSGRSADEGIEALLSHIRRLAGSNRIAVDDAVANSERATDFRNTALCNYLYALGKLTVDVDSILSAYCRQCAISMSCEELARCGRYLMLDGRSETHGECVLGADDVRTVNALMSTCGQYEGSGEFACSVGFAVKSGIGGGMLAIVPGLASIAVWSPGLDEHGNSLLGRQALKHIADRTGWSIFGAGTPLIRRRDEDVDRFGRRQKPRLD